MNDTIYGFLAKTYGLVERGHNIDIELEDTYKNFSKQQLKKEFSRLKKEQNFSIKTIKSKVQGSPMVYLSYKTNNKCS